MRMGNNYQIEGIDDNQRTGLLQVLIPPSEAIVTVDVAPRITMRARPFHRRGGQTFSSSQAGTGITAARTS